MINVDRSWTLFLDRDGVINRRLPGAYVRVPGEFEFLTGVPETIAELSRQFGRILVVTNQQGIGKGLMTTEDLRAVHQKMNAIIEAAGGRIDGIFFSPELTDDPTSRRKPKPAMALEARAVFPEIDFSRSVMVGDSISDIQFGRSLGMVTVLVNNNAEWEVALPKAKAMDPGFAFDYRISGLRDLPKILNAQ